MAVSALLASVVNKYATDYVAPLGRSSISLGPCSLSLSDLSLSPSFLNSLGLPINIVAAHLGKIAVKLNPAKLRVEVEIDGVELLTDTRVEIPVLEAQRALEACVKLKLGILAADEYIALGGAPKDGSIYFTLAKFLKVDIEKVHIRIQHREGGRDAAFGILLRHAGINSCRHTKRMTATEPGYSTIPLTISKMEVYLSGNNNSLLSVPCVTNADMRMPFENGFELKDNEKVFHEFAGALFLQNQKSNPDLPFLVVLLNTVGMGFTLSKQQVSVAVGYVTALLSATKQLIGVYEDATREAEGRDGTATERECYLTLYKATLNTDTAWLPHMKEQKEFLERNVKTTDIIAWRHDAIAQVRDSMRKAQKGKKRGEPLVALRKKPNLMPFYVGGGFSIALLLLYIWSLWRGFSIDLEAPVHLFITVILAVSMCICLAVGVKNVLPQGSIMPTKNTGAPVCRITVRTGRVSATLLDCLHILVKNCDFGCDFNIRSHAIGVSVSLVKFDLEDARAFAAVAGFERPAIHQRILVPYRKLLHSGPLKIAFSQSSLREEFPHRDITLKSQNPFEIILGHHSPIWEAVEFLSSLPTVSPQEEKVQPRSELEELSEQGEEEGEKVKSVTPKEAPPVVALLVEVDLQAKAKIVCANTKAVSYIIQLDTIMRTRVEMKQDTAITGQLQVSATLDRADFEHKLEHYDPIPIIAPFQAQAYVHMYPSEFFDGQQGISLNLDLGNIAVTFTTELYRIVMTSVIPILTPPDGVMGEPAEPPLPIPIGEGAPAPLIPAAAFVPPEVLSYGAQSVVVILRELRVQLVNDLLSAPSPLARVLLSNVNARLHAFGHERCLFSSMDVQGDFYNDRVVDWEPLIEPFHVLTNVTQSLQPLKYSRANNESTVEQVEFGFASHKEVKQFNDISIKTKGIVDINVTHAMNARIQDVMKMVNSLQDDDNEIIDKAKPYIFENCTEFHMDVMLQDGEKTNKLMSLEPNSLAPFHFHEEDVHKHKVTVEMKGTPWTPFPIQVSKVGVTAHSFLWEPSKDPREALPESEWKSDNKSKTCDHCGTEFSLFVRHHHCRGCGLVFCSKCSHDRVEGKRYCKDCVHYQLRNPTVDVQLIVQIEIRQGIKAVSLHSPIGIKNDTHTSMLVALPLTPACQNWSLKAATNHFAKSDTKTFVPHEVWWVPLLQAAYFSSKENSGLTKVYLRPADEYAPFDWSKPISIKHPPLFPATRGYECMDHARKLEEIKVNEENDESKQKLTKEAKAEKEHLLSELENKRPNFHFTVAHEELEAKSKEKKETELPGKLFTLYSVRDSLIVENLLPTSVHVQLFNNVHNDVGVCVGESNIEKGKRYHVGSSSLQPTFIKLHLAGYKESTMIDLKFSAKDQSEADRNVKIPLPSLVGSDELTVEIEIEKKLGAARLRIFVPYWFFDLTDLQLKFSEEGGENETVEKEEKVTDMRPALMFNFTKKRHLLHVRSRLSKWCTEPAPIQNVGLGGQIYLPGIGDEGPGSLSGIQYEVGVMVQKAGGRYSRTTIVEFSHRHVIQNQLSHDISIHQFESQNVNTPDLLTIKAGATIVYHSRVSHPKGKRPKVCALSFLRVGQEEALKAYNWSGYFDLDAVGDHVVSILDRVTMRCFYAHILVRLEGSTVFVRIGDLLEKSVGDLRLNVSQENIVALRYGVHFAVENRTTNQLMRMRQLLDHDKVMAAEESVWQEIGPGKWLPYDWVEPLHHRKLEIEVGLLPPREEHVELGELKLIAYLEMLENNQAVVRVQNISGHNLRAMDRNLIGQRTASDPYVGLRIVPGVGEVRTQTIQKELNPEWPNEHFEFGITADQIPFHALELRVMDQDTVTKDDLIGYATIPLESLPTHKSTDILPSAMYKLKRHPLGFRKFKFRTEIDPNELSASVARFGPRKGPNVLRMFVVPDGPLNVIVLSNAPSRKYEPFPTKALLENLQPEKEPEPVENLMKVVGPPDHTRVELTLKVAGGRNFTIREPIYCKIEFMHAVAQTDPVVPVDGAVEWRKKFSTVLRLDRLERVDPEFIFSLYARRDILTDKCLGTAHLSWNDFEESQQQKFLPFVDSATGSREGDVRLVCCKREIYPEDYPDARGRRGSEDITQSRRGSEVEFKFQSESRRGSGEFSQIDSEFLGRRGSLESEPEFVTRPSESDLLRRGSDSSMALGGIGFENIHSGSTSSLAGGDGSTKHSTGLDMSLRRRGSDFFGVNMSDVGENSRSSSISESCQSSNASNLDMSLRRRGSDFGINMGRVESEPELISHPLGSAALKRRSSDPEISSRRRAPGKGHLRIHRRTSSVKSCGSAPEIVLQPGDSQTQIAGSSEGGELAHGVGPAAETEQRDVTPSSSLEQPTPSKAKISPRQSPKQETESAQKTDSSNQLTKPVGEEPIEAEKRVEFEQSPPASDETSASHSPAHPDTQPAPSILVTPPQIPSPTTSPVVYMQDDGKQSSPEEAHKDTADERAKEEEEEKKPDSGGVLSTLGPASLQRTPSANSISSSMAEDEEYEEELLTSVTLGLLGVEGLQETLGDLYIHARVEGIVELSFPGTHRLAAFLIKDATGEVNLLEWERTMEIFIPNSVLDSRSSVLKIRFHVDKISVADAQPENLEDTKFPFILGEVIVNLNEIPLDDFEAVEKKIKEDKELSKCGKKRQIAELKVHKKSVATWKHKECPMVLSIGESKQVEPQVLLSVHKQKCRAFNRRPYFRVTADVEGVGVSLIDSTPQEIAYVSLRQFHVRLEDALEQATASVSLDHMQLDNQLPDAAFDIVLAPTVVPKDKKQPVLQATAIMAKDTRHKCCIMFQQFAVLLQSLDLRVEEMLLWNMLNYINQFYSASTEEEPPSEEDASKAAVLPENMAGATQVMFFRELGLQPIAVNLTFRAANPDQRSGGHELAGGPLGLLLKTILAAVTAFAGNISDAPVRLNAKLCSNVKGDQAYLIKVFMDHYIREAIMEAYKVVGSLDFLGNPVGLAKNVSTGMTEFFYEPALGLMKSPEDFGKGLAKGSSSLLTHTLGGVFGSASTVAGVVGNLASTLTMDQEFIRRRSAKNVKPKHALSGVAKGARSVGKGISSGVKGVVEQPRRGVKDEGAAGFAKGMGKGIVGLAVKPVVGVVDGVSLALKGIGNTADYLLNEQRENKPVRKQRYMPNRVLRSYVEGEKQRPPEIEEKSKVKKLLSRG